MAPSRTAEKENGFRGVGTDTRVCPTSSWAAIGPSHSGDPLTGGVSALRPRGARPTAISPAPGLLRFWNSFIGAHGSGAAIRRVVGHVFARSGHERLGVFVRQRHRGNIRAPASLVLVDPTTRQGCVVEIAHRGARAADQRGAPWLVTAAYDRSHERRLTRATPTAVRRAESLPYTATRCSTAKEPIRSRSISRRKRSPT